MMLKEYDYDCGSVPMACLTACSETRRPTVDEKAWEKLASDMTSSLAALAYILDGQRQILQELTGLRGGRKVTAIVGREADEGTDQLGETLSKLLAVATDNNRLLRRLTAARR
jgi:hypothetical protein